MRRLLSMAALVAISGLCSTHPLYAQANVEHGARLQPVAAEHQPQAAGKLVTSGQAPQGEAAAHAAPASGHHDEEDVSFSDINWTSGLLGESDDPQPSLLFRPKGMPAPFLSNVINWLVLVWLIVTFAKKQLPAALKKRKANLVSGMEEAGRVKAQAAARLAELENKLSRVDEEIERIKSEMQQASELERQRILREADERRARMERDAARLIETELEGAKEQLRRDVVTAALRQATQEVSRQMTSSDQERLFNEALGSLKGLPNKSLGGRA